MIRTLPHERRLVSEDVAPRGMLRLLVDRSYGPFLLGRVLSTTAIWMHNIVSAVLAYQISGSTLVVAIVSVAQFVPQILFAPFSGALADRGNRRRQVVFGRFVTVCGSGGMAVYITLIGADNMAQVWPVVLASGFVGVGFVIGGPAMNALIPALVREGELAPAVVLSSIPSTFARAAGPAIGTIIALQAGPEYAFAIAALFHVIFAVIMIRVTIGGVVRVQSGDSSVRAGFRHLRQDPTLILLLLAIASIGAGTDPAITLTPALSEAAGRHTDLVGLLASSFGIGAGVAFLLLPIAQHWLNAARIATLGLFVLGAGTVLLAVLTSPVGASLLFGIVGIGMTFALTSCSTQIQARIPEQFRGRIMALWSVAFLGARPIAATFNGAVTDWFDVRVALVATGIVVLAATWLCRPSRIRPLPPSLV